MNVSIIGGGLTGLTAAYYLGHARPDWTISLYEASHRFGGKIQTRRVGDCIVELGPDSYLGRKTDMTDLINALGLGDTLVANDTGQAYVYDRGATHPIPGGSIMGIPTEIMPFVKASLISWSGKIRAGLDYFKGTYPTDADGDVSIGDFFLYHLGREMMDKLIEPLLAGIYGGDIYKISLLSTFPHFLQVEQKYGNMVKGMMAAKQGHKKAGSGAPEAPSAKSGRTGSKSAADSSSPSGTAYQSGMFRQLTGGLESVIDAIVENMPGNVKLCTQTAVSDMSYEDRLYTLTLQEMENIRTVQSDAVIIATQPSAYNSWFRDDSGFDYIRHMEQSSCAIAVMAFDKETFDGVLKGSGLLITRKTDTPLTACTILNQKWPTTTPDDSVILRVFIGKPGDDAVESLDDEELTALAVREIQRIMHFSASPQWVQINRLIHCMPQYYVGHRAGIGAVRAHVEKEYPNLYLIGTPFDGIGIPDGVKQAKGLADRLAKI